MTERLPEKVGPFLVEALLDRGGMSILYLSTDQDTGVSVVLKVLQDKYLGRQDFVDRFLHECELLEQVDHPGIVKYIDSGVWSGGHYLALEYVQGISLRKWIQQAPLSLTRALEVIMEIAGAVCHLHTHGIIHRDLKPENLLLTEEGKVKLIDLGIARKIDEEEGIEESKRFIGTPTYMSPEQQEDPRSVSFPSDIFSLGVIAYELILGRLSHGHIHLSLMPKGFQKILGKALQPNPADRYSNLVDFITDVALYQEKVLESPSKEGFSPLALALEGLERGLEDLSPKEIPKLEGIEIFASHQRGILSAPFVFDLVPQSKGVTLFYGESGSFGTRGAIEVSVLRGMEKGLEGPISKRGERLRLLVEADPSTPLYKVSYLDLQENAFGFLSFGRGSLIHVHEGEAVSLGGEAPALGVVTSDDLPIVHGSWKKGDLLIFDPSGVLLEVVDRLPPYHGEGKKWLQLVENRFRGLSSSRLEGRSSLLILFIKLL